MRQSHDAVPHPIADAKRLADFSEPPNTPHCQARIFPEMDCPGNGLGISAIKLGRMRTIRIELFDRHFQRLARANSNRFFGGGFSFFQCFIMIG